MRDLAEARKLGVSVVSANQYLEQYEGSMRAAVLSVGTQILFQLSASDAERMGAALGGGRQLKQLLRNLSQRELVLKSGSLRHERVQVPELISPPLRTDFLLHRSNRHYARLREVIEAEIAKRQGKDKRSLDAWD
ncbi:MAG TPA: hypothetical protein VFS20_23895 [Longimicrobium sp.]|nr:hypothetical protein [Longimicrobium sp.]